MAYGKGNTKDMLKRMADLGRPDMSFDLSELRSRCLVVTSRMASIGFSPHVTDPIPDPKSLDEILLREQRLVAKEKFLNVVWAEKCRLLAKPAIVGQMIGRWLFLKPKETASQALSLAAE